MVNPAAPHHDLLVKVLSSLNLLAKINETIKMVEISDSERVLATALLENLWFIYSRAMMMVDFGNLVANKTETTKLSNSLLGFLFCFKIPNVHHERNVDMLLMLYSSTDVIPPLNSGSSPVAAGAAPG